MAFMLPRAMAISHAVRWSGAIGARAVSPGSTTIKVPPSASEERDLCLGDHVKITQIGTQQSIEEGRSGAGEICRAELV